MTWRHDVTSSYKYKTDNIFELSNPKFHRNKKRIIFLALLQAEIGKISLGASCCDVMTSQCHAVRLNQNLSTVSCEWDLELWKIGLKNIKLDTRIMFLSDLQAEVLQIIFWTPSWTPSWISDEAPVRFWPILSKMNQECIVNISCNFQLAPNFFWVKTLIYNTVVYSMNLVITRLRLGSHCLYFLCIIPSL